MVEKKKNPGENREEKIHELNKILDRIDPNEPNEEDLDAFKLFIMENPEVVVALTEFSSSIRYEIIRNSFSNPILTILLEAETTQIRKELGYDSAPMIERLLIDNLLNCMIRCQSLEYFNADASPMKIDRPTLEFWDKRMDVANRRYLRAFETYSKVKKIVASNSRLK